MKKRLAQREAEEEFRLPLIFHHLLLRLLSWQPQYFALFPSGD